MNEDHSKARELMQVKVDNFDLQMKELIRLIVFDSPLIVSSFNDLVDEFSEIMNAYDTTEIEPYLVDLPLLSTWVDSLLTIAGNYIGFKNFEPRHRVVFENIEVVFIKNQIGQIRLMPSIEAIKFRLEQMNLEPSALISILGSKSRASEILNRKRKLSLSMIRILHKKLNIPASSLIADFSK